MTKTVFISRELSESSPFATRLQAAGWAVQGFSLVTLTPLPVGEVPELDWIFFASGNAVRFFFDGSNPSPDPSPKREGGRRVDGITTPLPFRGGVGGGVSGEEIKKGTVYSTNASQWKYLKGFARSMRKAPTEAEKAIWELVRNNRLSGLKFRRQHPIDDYIVDFVNLDLRLVIEVDGSIHEMQPEYDQLRTERLNQLGYTVIRFSNDEVLKNLPAVTKKLESEIEHMHSNPSPDPSPKREGGRDAVHSTSPLPFRGGVGGGVAARKVRFAALGSATATDLLHYTDQVDFTGTGDPTTTAELFRPLALGQRVLFPAARHSQKSIARLLGDAIYAIHIAIYDNAPIPDPPRLNAEVLVFTSPMNAQAYFGKHPLQPQQRVVAIGQTTERALVDLGITGVQVADEPKELALAEAVLILGQ